MEQNLSQYKIFYEVAKAGNISKAAKELYISQPAISKAIGKLEDSLGQLDCFDPALVTVPADAYLSDYVSGQGYSIVPETEGTTLDMDKVRAQVEQAISSLAPELDLDALGCYKAPSIRSDNTSLAAARDARNRYVNMTVTYTFGSKTEVLDGDEIPGFIYQKRDGSRLKLRVLRCNSYFSSSQETLWIFSDMEESY